MTKTVRELLNWGQDELRTAAIENSRFAAEVMLRALLNLRRIDLFLDINRTIDGDLAAKFRDMIGRKTYHEPLQYIVGATEWYGLTIKCDRRALVPRPETEIVVEKALAIVKNRQAPRIADIGTGTGCIALAVAATREDATVIATDLSPTALQLAQENVTAHQFGHRILLRPGELLEPLGKEEFDMIISNPPYVRESEYPGLMPEVRDFEPRGALVAGADGLEALRPLIELAPKNLKAGGTLVLEFGIDHAAPVTEIARKSGAYGAPEIIIDYNRRPRGVILTKL